MKTTHNLPFEACPWWRDPEGPIQLFRIGSCEGQWMATEFAYCIIAVINNKPGNGHLDDVFEWFENSCKRDGKYLVVMELMNERFRNHLITKRGFSEFGKRDNLIKYFFNPKNLV